MTMMRPTCARRSQNRCVAASAGRLVLRLIHRLLGHILPRQGIEARHTLPLCRTIALRKPNCTCSRPERAKTIGRIVHIQGGIDRQRIGLVNHTGINAPHEHFALATMRR